FTLTSSVPGLLITLINGNFKQVARGVGQLDARVPAGIYELRYEAGPALEKRLITLRPGQNLTERLGLAFPSAAPVEGSDTSHEYQMDASRRATEQIMSAPPGAAGLVLMLRNLRGQDDVPFDRARLDTLSVSAERIE